MSRFIPFVVLLVGIALFAAVAVFAHVDFNEYRQQDCFVDSVATLSNNTTVLHYFFWDEDGVERVYQDQGISASEAGQYQKGNEFKCLFYKGEKKFYHSFAILRRLLAVIVEYCADNARICDSHFELDGCPTTVRIVFAACD